MLIPVEYTDHNFGYVDPANLDDLIRNHLVVAFRRTGGWVKLRREPVMGNGGDNSGPGRRDAGT